ncbi:DNA-deoxyinosine glycosylase [Silvimonas soli]|uniref:DNA-deoxyinosine glycosylase n=1 Tax=Silvimonas soli TaxID=2980100 RepID=UPI0024B39E40|nr:DNA-deoxyinosine glycosylase [Silvimonas soli]
MDLKRCFPPVVDQHTRLLLLGSLPGERSLAQAQYYAHPQNRFWELVGAVIGVDLRAQSYEMRLATLLAHHIGLWDVIAEAERQGSLDAAIRNQSHNALAELVKTLPALKAVGFNGGTSARIGRRQLLGISGLTLIDLPSSSPAYTLALAQKQQAWQQLVSAL